jgi:drug/metabolite transporter (DMT)-like permease
MSHLYGTVLMFLAACSYGVAAIIIKLAYGAGLHPASLLTLQNAVAILIMWPMLLISQGRPHIGGRQLVRLIVQGLGGNFALSVCYFWAAQRIEISLLSLILFTYPVFVLGYQMVFEARRASAGEWLALFSAVAGAALAADPFHGAGIRLDRWGFALSVGAAVSYAFMNIHGWKLAGALSSQVITSVTSTVSTIAMMAAMPASYWFTVHLTAGQWLYIVALALLSTVLPMNLMYAAIRRIGAFHASVVSVAELPCILVLAYLILHERMNSGQTAGGCLILLSLILMQKPADFARPAPS